MTTKIESEKTLKAALSALVSMAATVDFLENPTFSEKIGQAAIDIFVVSEQNNEMRHLLAEFGFYFFFDKGICGEEERK